MTHRRPAPLVLAAAVAVLVACTDASTQFKSVPYGFLTVVAQASGPAYTANVVGSFYDASGLSIPAASAPWDSCRAQAYSASGGTSLGTVFPSMNAGSSIQVKLGARTDSLFPVAVATETQYQSRLPSGIPYTPGDSVRVVIPGAAGDLGFAAISFTAKTAEAFTVQDFVPPAVGSRLDLRWTPGQDLNNTMVFSFRFAALGSDQLNQQVMCQFRDDGADSVPARYVSAWVSSPTQAWSASRVRTWIAPAGTGYFDFISTFDIPTPTAP
ncbi:MAG: hypothetical protein ACYC3L_06455 [Gemmatimonadaceae bacterium]